MPAFSKTVTINGGTAISLASLLSAGGYASGYIGVRRKLTAPADRSLFIGADSSVSDSGANKGREVLPTLTEEDSATGRMGNVVDPSLCWVYVAASPTATADIGVYFVGM